jgi:hypothetical protein
MGQHNPFRTFECIENVRERQDVNEKNNDKTLKSKELERFRKVFPSTQLKSAEKTKGKCRNISCFYQIAPPRFTHSEVWGNASVLPSRGGRDHIYTFFFISTPAFFA